MTDDTRDWGDIATRVLFENDRVRVWELQSRIGPRGLRRAVLEPIETV